jgi:hypothetical protein
VSAVTIEEEHNTPAFAVSLASNHTPTPYVVEGLSKALNIVNEHAHEAEWEINPIGWQCGLCIRPSGCRN